jgi:hypothetical protein
VARVLQNLTLPSVCCDSLYRRGGLAGNKWSAGWAEAPSRQIWPVFPVVDHCRSHSPGRYGEGRNESERRKYKRAPVEIFASRGLGIWPKVMGQAAERRLGGYLAARTLIVLVALTSVATWVIARDIVINRTPGPE